MGTKYSSTTVAGFNASPPPDDGSTQASNKITWAGIKQKLADPLNTWAASINSKLVTALDTSVVSVTGTYGASASDNARKLQAAGTFTLTLGDAATLAAGWWTDIFVESGTVTLAHATGGDTINGQVISTLTLPAQTGLRAAVNATSDGFIIDHLSNITFDQLTGTVTSFVVPSGVIWDYGGSAAPAGWLICDGTAIDRTTYANLFAIIGTAFGVGNGVTTFNIPDYRRRVSVGAGGSGTATLANTVGSTGGEERHTLSTAELATHTHSDPGHVHQEQLPAGAVRLAYVGGTTGVGSNFTFDDMTAHNYTDNIIALNTASATTGIGSAGSGSSHNNLQPSVVVNKIIKT